MNGHHETARYFTCAGCGAHCRANNTEQEAAMEMLTNYRSVIPKDDQVSVCDDCYRRFQQLRGSGQL